uniref:Uncharacterized protein n=1 Tax=Lepeophtheirus salmonis TaxID=72036 RepID=A0A0K2TV28_LEPSM
MSPGPLSSLSASPKCWDKQAKLEPQELKRKQPRPIPQVHEGACKRSRGFTSDCRESYQKSGWKEPCECGDATFEISNKNKPYLPLQDSFE